MSFENPSSVEKKSLEQLKTEAQNDIGFQLAGAGVTSTFKDAEWFENRLEHYSNIEEFINFLQDKYGEECPSIINYAKISKKLNNYFENKNRL